MPSVQLVHEPWCSHHDSEPDLEVCSHHCDSHGPLPDGDHDVHLSIVQDQNEDEPVIFMEVRPFDSPDGIYLAGCFTPAQLRVIQAAVINNHDALEGAVGEALRVLRDAVSGGGSQ